ncbi:MULTISPECIES: hypothetical protein [Sphingobacterium]|uniref:hypothetical protein n=1 Tax=Sphingobacterium TaxID=28453 RepID=UPI0028A8D9C7|nr:hypothetical protein [Sphingobacterium multivorum]
MKIKIFYSWQSTDQKHNKNFIYNCLRAAEKKLRKSPEYKNVDFELTDAIRTESGQVPIADTIIEKIIPDCDIFVADLTANRRTILDKLFSKKIPAPNPNVMTEYGVALRSLGKERIISIINTYTNGSPKADSSIIPFDIRHDRFPTEYNYSKKNESQKDKIKDDLTNDLVIVLRLAIKNVLTTQKNKFRPFVVWKELDEKLKHPQQKKFIASEKFDEIKKNVRSLSNLPCIRILGLSGLGKTRILLEIFRPEDENISLIFSNRLLYVNCNDYQERINFTELISHISEKKKDAILVVDNCDLETHRLISRNLKDLALISIDSNPEETINTEDTNYIIIKKNDLASVVSQLVDNEFQNVGEENIEKIKNFSQGIPLMAVLLADSIKKGEKFLGKLNEKELLDNLLGAKGKDQEWRNILRSCSMFSYFGFEGNYDIQYKLIATNENITISNNSQQVRINTFLEVINHFKGREIIESRGRFLSIRPFPLAMALAVEWLETCTSERILNVINDIANLEHPHKKQLINSLSDQMKYLGYNDKAVEIIDKIVGPGSPFDNAEVINTELGSRLFRSFVEVNPIAVSGNFKRIFSALSTDQLLEIKDGRRNIVWVLEKLCFDKRTFADSCKILFSFAVAENETWSNNATGQFLHLFNTFLSGTESNLNERWNIIEWGLNKIEPKYFSLALSAMKVGLNAGRFTRMMGAEHQGNKRLIDNEPTWEEIKEYRTNILQKLLEIIKLNNEYSETAGEIVANHIRSFYRMQMADLVIPFLKEIAEIKNYSWNKGLNGLKQSRKYEKELISEEILYETNNLINSLTKTDFSSKYLALSNSYYLDSDERYSSDAVIKAFIDLADEFISSNVSWEETFPAFYKNQQVYSYYFGKRIAELLKNDIAKIERFISYSLEIISEIPRNERNLTVLRSFVTSSSEEVKKNFYNHIFQLEEFRQDLFYYLSSDSSGSQYFDLLFQLLETGVVSISNFSTFGFTSVLHPLSLEELEVFCEKLFNSGDEGYAVIFDLLFDLGYGDESKKAMLLPIIKKCIKKLGFNRKFYRQLDDYKWSEAIIGIIAYETEGDFAEFINRSIIESITWNNNYNLDPNIQRIYEILMKTHFDRVWPDLANALLSTDDDYCKFYGLKYFLGSFIGGIGRNVGVLFDGKIDTIFEWCKANRDLAPSRIAELVPIFDTDRSKGAKWHPVSLQLLNDFGDIQQVLDHLGSNMGSYSCTGSIVPYLESKVGLFRQISDHKIDLVRQWANSYIEYLNKEIEIEKYRDEERFL